MSLGITTAGDALDLDLDRLIGGHACIIANSGGGKSGLVRKVLEETHGQIQHIILDIEDEFYTLRERFDYVIAGGEGGDVPAGPDSAKALALGALEHGFSLIVQMNDMGAAGAGEFVANFLEVMISAPRHLWRPVLVVIDEAQRFAPSGGADMREGKAVRALTSQGRKRGFTALLASQRIAKVDPNVRGDINNWMLGRVGQALDRNAMADQLGFSAKEGREALTGIQDRHFWAFGPAIAAVPTLFRTGDVVTTPVRPGQAKIVTPPAPEALREILAGMAPVASAVEGSVEPDGKLVHPDASEMLALRSRLEELLAERAELVHTRQLWHDLAQSRGLVIQRASAALQANGDELLEIPAKGGGGPEVDDGQTEDRIAIEQAAPRVKPQRQRQEPREVTVGETATPLNAAARKMLDMLDRIAPARVTWTSLAAMIGNKARGGNFNAARKAMRESGLIVEDGDTVRSLRPPSEMMSREQARQLWKSVLTNPAPRMIDALGVRAMSRADLGEALGIAPRGGNFNNGVAQLVRNGVAVDRGGVLHLAEPLPGEVG